MDLELRTVPYSHPDAVALTALAQQYYVQTYGNPDESPVDDAEFAAPHGRFLVGYLPDSTAPVAMAGWRFTTEPIPGAVRPAELKRMFVRQDRRGLGLARRLLAAVEQSSAAAGADWLVLETGSLQTEAIALYRSAGYSDVPGFGHYAGSPLAVTLGKSLASTTVR